MIPHYGCYCYNVLFTQQSYLQKDSASSFRLAGLHLFQSKLCHPSAGKAEGAAICSCRGRQYPSLRRSFTEIGLLVVMTPANGKFNNTGESRKPRLGYLANSQNKCLMATANQICWQHASLLPRAKDNKKYKNGPRGKLLVIIDKSIISREGDSCTYKLKSSKHYMVVMEMIIVKENEWFPIQYYHV